MSIQRRNGTSRFLVFRGSCLLWQCRGNSRLFVLLGFFITLAALFHNNFDKRFSGGIFLPNYPELHALRTEKTDTAAGATVVEAGASTSSSHDCKVSVIIATCNRLRSLHEAVDSVLHQSLPVYEVIIALDVGGASCVKELDDSVWQNKNNTTSPSSVRVVHVPPCAADATKKCGAAGRIRNYGVAQASVEATHFAFLDDDDVWLPHKMERQLEAMGGFGYQISSSDAYSPRNRKGNRCRGNKYVPHDISVVVVSNSSSIDNTSSSHNVLLLPAAKYEVWNTGLHKNRIRQKLQLQPGQWEPLPTNVTVDLLQKHNYYITSSVVMTKDAFLGFDEEMLRHEDIELWERTMTKFSPGLFVPEPLLIYDNRRNKECEHTVR